MKNIKCLLGHNLHMMKSNDVIKNTYDNEDENITIYKCKYCNKIVMQATNFIKIKLKEKKEIIDNTKTAIKISEYENWSPINTRNHIYIRSDYDSGIIHLISMEKINEVEKFGILEIVKSKFSRYKEFDIRAYVSESEYDKDEDSIKSNNYYPEYRNYYEKTIATSKEFSSYNKSELKDAKKIITIRYTILNKRNSKSKWWRFRNPRILEIINKLDL